MTKIEIIDAQVIGIDREGNDLILGVSAGVEDNATEIKITFINGVSKVLPSLLTRVTNISKETV